MRSGFPKLCACLMAITSSMSAADQTIGGFDAPQNREADEAWAEVEGWDIALPTVDGLTYFDAVRWGVGSVEFTRWWAAYRQELRAKGLRFWEKFPRDPRRFQWLIRTIQADPPYWIDPATPNTGVNEAERNSWNERYVLMRAEFMSSLEIDSQLRARLRYLELYDSIAAIRPGANQGHDEEALTTLANDILDAGRMPLMRGRDMDTLARNFISIVEPVGRLEEVFVRAIKLSPHPELQSLSKGHEEVMRLREEPLSLRLGKLGGGHISVSELRGKVVLIDMWSNYCTACIDLMPKLRAAQRKYGEHGFHIVGVWMDTAMKKEDADKALAILKKQGVTWSNGMLTGEELVGFKEKYAIKGVPVTWLIDQNGLLVTTDVSGQRLDSEIRRLLGIESSSM